MYAESRTKLRKNIPIRLMDSRMLRTCLCLTMILPSLSFEHFPVPPNSVGNGIVLGISVFNFTYAQNHTRAPLLLQAQIAMQGQPRAQALWGKKQAPKRSSGVREPRAGAGTVNVERA